jgi:peptide/nickel transport system ATP-binding protein
MSAGPLASFEGVSVEFGRVRAVDDVTLALPRGAVLGLVGESGSGKTTLCRVLLGLTAAARGRALFDGRPVPDHMARDALGFRRRVQMLLQDAVASLSPRMTVRAAMEEPLRIHGLPLAEGRARLDAICRRLGLPADLASKYPHQISGGQARRVGAARALVLRPELLVADEPTAGLDVSVQGEFLNLLLDMKAELGLTYLLVSHNLGVIRRVTDRTAVMYLGQIVEEAPTRALFRAPAHPYAAALVSTSPVIDPARRRRRIVLEGEIPSVVAPPPACRFHTRCPAAQPVCTREAPALAEVAPGRRARCHFPFVLAEAAGAPSIPA